MHPRRIIPAAEPRSEDPGSARVAAVLHLNWAVAVLARNGAELLIASISARASFWASLTRLPLRRSKT